MSLKRIVVECKFRIPIEVDINSNYKFQIEENGCPGTGIVWSALSERIKHAEDNNYCWACELGGKNRIVEEEE